MRRLLVALLLLNISFAHECFSQRLSLNDLISFVSKDISDVNESLSLKKWDFLSSKKIGDEYRSTWVYDMDYDSTALGWLSIESKENFSNVVSFRFNDISNYQQILLSIKNLGLKKINSSITENGNLLTTYKGKTYTYKITSGHRFHKLVVFNNADMLRNILSALRDASSSVDTLTYIYSTTLKKDLKYAPLRKEDEIDSEVAYSVKPDDEIEIYRRSALYYYVKVKGLWGYISKSFLNDW